jgi:hypothetical protein
VENLWMNGEYPVHDRTTKKNLAPVPVLRPNVEHVCIRFRASLRLIERGHCVQFTPFRSHKFLVATVAADLHRFQESIGGRSYLIEVAPVTQNRWRAYIVRIPGVPTALMPFYGSTPADAARHLREWLTRAHQQAVSPRPV